MIEETVLDGYEEVAELDVLLEGEENAEEDDVLYEVEVDLGDELQDFDFTFSSEGYDSETIWGVDDAS